MSATPPSYWSQLVASLPHEWWAWWRGRSDVLQAALGHPPSAAEIRQADEIAAADCLATIDAYDSFMWQSLASVPGTEEVHRVDETRLLATAAAGCARADGTARAVARPLARRPA